MKKKPEPTPIEPDDVSKRLFLTALHAAVERVGGSFKLGLKLGVQQRNLDNWRKGRMPSYADMQRHYFEFVETIHEVMHEEK